MARFLRQIAEHHDPSISAAIAHAEGLSIFPMYQHYATPLRSDGCAKLSIGFREEPALTRPLLALDVMTVDRPFDLVAFNRLDPRDRRRHILDELHACVIAVGEPLGWQLAKAEEARERILREDFQFRFTWKSPKANPGRTLRASVEVTFANEVELHVIFQSGKGVLVQRTLFSKVGPGWGMVRFVLGSLTWTDDSHVQISHENGRDHWICGADGTLQFFFPRADHGEAQGIYELGRMYCQGLYVLQDVSLGRQLVEQAAAKFYPHAISYLERLARPQS